MFLNSLTPLTTQTTVLVVMLMLSILSVIFLLVLMNYFKGEMKKWKESYIRNESTRDAQANEIKELSIENDKYQTRIHAQATVIRRSDNDLKVCEELLRSEKATVIKLDMHKATIQDLLEKEKARTLELTAECKELRKKYNSMIDSLNSAKEAVKPAPEQPQPAESPVKARRGRGKRS